MQVESFFEWLGQALGSIIRFIVDGLSGLFNILGNAGGNFVDGLAKTLGMDTSIISILALIVGLMLLWSAIRAFMNASIIAGIIYRHRCLPVGASLLAKAVCHSAQR